MGSRDQFHRLRVGAAGATPVTSIPWPILFRRRVARRLERSPRYGGYVLGVALAGMFSVAFTVTILGVAIRDIAAEFDASESVVSWVITGPILAVALVGPALGRAGDMFGHRRMYLLSMGLSAVFALMIALSWNEWSLITFRVLGAIGGAATGPSAMAMINRAFEPERRVQAMGYWSMVGAGAPVLGVVFGGPIVDNYNWRWIFVFQAPLSLLAVLLAALVLPETSREDGLSFDWRGAVALGTVVGFVLLVVNRGAAWGLTSPAVVLGLVGIPLAGWWFWSIERRGQAPLFPPHYARMRNVSAPIIAQLTMNFAYMGGFILTPLLLQDDSTFGFTATKAGLYTIARPLTFAVVGPLMGWLALKVGERTNAVVGSSALFGSMLILALGASRLDDTLILLGLAISGFGLGTAGPSLTAVMANAVDESDFGIAGAAQQMASQVGVVIGIELMQAVQIGGEATAGVADSFARAYLVGGLVSGLAIFAAARVVSTERADHAAA
ncbi:MAG: MFS transporter [Acidimicrobiales bacterium]|nr:MFS transporter [Acidimicrobiales bacterium]